MGTGNVTLYWYAGCCFFTMFVFFVASALVGYGNWVKRKEAKARAERAALADKTFSGDGAQ